MVNFFTAACHQGLVPDELHPIEYLGVTVEVDQALDLATTSLTAYGGNEPTQVPD